MTDSEEKIEFVDRPSAKLVQTNASDDMVAMAAWVSFDKNQEERLKDEPGKAGLIHFLMREKHMSPFEHGQFTFLVDCPMDVRTEFQRHRTFSYNEVSGRYTVLKPRFYIPPKGRPVVQQGKTGNYFFVEDEQLRSEYADDLREKNKWDWEHYQRQLNKGIAKEVARKGLPMNMMTQFYATVNPRNLMAFLELRTDPQAMIEIQQVAHDMEAALAHTMGYTYSAWLQRREKEVG